MCDQVSHYCGHWTWVHWGWLEEALVVIHQHPSPHWSRPVTVIINALAHLSCAKTKHAPTARENAPRSRLDSLQHVEMLCSGKTSNALKHHLFLTTCKSILSGHLFLNGSQSQVLNKKCSMTGVSVGPAIVPDCAFAFKAIQIPLASTEHWFQNSLWIRKSTDVQVLYS